MAKPQSRPTTRISTRQRVTMPKKHHVGNEDATAPKLSLLDLPPEVLDLIVKDIKIHDMAVLARTNKSVRAYIEPRLYDKIYTRINTGNDTAGLVRLLHNRPDIIPLIKTLVLDEYHPCHTRHLLAIKMPNLWCLLIQQEDDSFKLGLGDRRMRKLNRSLTEQPKLINCELIPEDISSRSVLGRRYPRGPSLRCPMLFPALISRADSCQSSFGRKNNTHCQG